MNAPRPMPHMQLGMRGSRSSREEQTNVAVAGEPNPAVQPNVAVAMEPNLAAQPNLSMAWHPNVAAQLPPASGMQCREENAGGQHFQEVCIYLIHIISQHYRVLLVLLLSFFSDILVPCVTKQYRYLWLCETPMGQSNGLLF